jgi:ferric-dicitrate binding protein FerR (iron transport regulator)
MHCPHTGAGIQIGVLPMTEENNLPERLTNLIDDYLDGLLDEAGVGELEALLRADAEHRAFFVRYMRLHTDLHLEMRARQAGQRALETIDHGAQQEPAAAKPARGATLKGGYFRRLLAPRNVVVAASLLVAVGAGWRLITASPAARSPAVAWLVNAQNCKWADEVEPAGNMEAGRILSIERGLAEIHFQCGARVVLEGPARLELLAANSARLLHGKLSARVPEAAAGFEILSPEAKVVDLGTEFGMAVADNGATDVYVFEGKVEAHPANAGPQCSPVSLAQHQGAQIANGKIHRRAAAPATGAGQFVRAIVPSPVIRARSCQLRFDQAQERGLRDAVGQGTGLTYRLPGTGSRWPDLDPNLRLDTRKARLELTTTNSDLNTQYKLSQGEYLGVRLADVGFTGKEDFAVAATFLDIPALEFVGQFGLYAGARSDLNIRGGLLSNKRDEAGQYTQFLVNNHDKGRDTDIYKVGLLSTGTDLRVTLKRTGGKYSLTVDNLTDGSSSTLSIRHPEFLDQEPDLFVGMFGANTQSNVRKTLLVKDFTVTVWTVSSPPPPIGPAPG